MGDYVKTMRAMIGKRPLLICGAGVIVRRGGEVLLQKRADNGFWGYHGGCLELGERLEDAARRELLEETGLTARSLRFFGVFSGPDIHCVYPNGDEIYIVDVVYVCEDFEGEPTPQPEEVSELRWFPIGALPAPINPSERPILREFAADPDRNGSRYK